MFFGSNWIELSQRFANACLNSGFHLEIHLKAKSVSVRFETVAFSWTRWVWFEVTVLHNHTTCSHLTVTGAATDACR